MSGWLILQFASERSSPRNESARPSFGLETGGRLKRRGFLPSFVEPEVGVIAKSQSDDDGCVLRLTALVDGVPAHGVELDLLGFAIPFPSESEREHAREYELRAALDETGSLLLRGLPCDLFYRWMVIDRRVAEYDPASRHDSVRFGPHGEILVQQSLLSNYSGVIELNPNAPTISVAHVLTASTALGGRIIGFDGTPQEGARIALFHHEPRVPKPDGTGGIVGRRQVMAVRSDHAGRFRFEGVPPGEGSVDFSFVDVENNVGFGGLDFSLNLSADEDLGDLFPVDGPSIDLEVHAAIRGVPCEFSDLYYLEEGFAGYRMPVVVTVYPDSRGAPQIDRLSLAPEERYRLRGVEYGRITAEVRLKDGAVAIGEPRSADLRITDDRFSVTGGFPTTDRLVVYVDHEHVARREVRFNTFLDDGPRSVEVFIWSGQGDDFSRHSPMLTNDVTRLQFESAPGDYHLLARAGMVEYGLGGKDVGSVESPKYWARARFALGDDSHEPVEVVLQPSACSISGRVIDQHGEIVEGHVVKLRPVEFPEVAGWPLTAVSNADGCFLIDALPPGMAFWSQKEAGVAVTTGALGQVSEMTVVVADHYR